MKVYRRNLPKQERSKETVAILLKATARVLERRGFAKATTNRIAEVAGVSIGTLYQYFPSKEALVAALIQQHQDEIMGLMVKEWEKGHGRWLVCRRANG